MNKSQHKQLVKGTALNKIRKIYNPKYKFSYDAYSRESNQEQRESEIEKIIINLEKELKEIDTIYKFKEIERIAKLEKFIRENKV
jgi:hypothetical protein